MFGTIFKAGERCATLLAHAEGPVLHSGELGLEQLLSVAAMAALFKHTMALIPFKLRDQRKVLAGLAGSYAHRRQRIIARALRLSTPREYVEPIQTCLAAKQQLIARVKPWLQDDRSWKGAVVHGDFHNENIIFHNGCATWVIDLEETRLGWDGEDVVTFAILASGQAEISGAALERIAPLIHSFRVLTGVGRQDISASIYATLMRLAASTRLEEWALTDTSGVAIALVCRDATRFESILASIEDIHEVWAWS
jgi:Ser/Thr protein kinase RdoA (MazF antagonist)